MAGADLRAALVASCFLGALPPVDFLAVCLVRAIVENVCYCESTVELIIPKYDTESFEIFLYQISTFILKTFSSFLHHGNTECVCMYRRTSL